MKLRNVLLFFSFILAGSFVSLLTHAQISREGIPPSFTVEGLSSTIQVVDIQPIGEDVIQSLDENLLTSPGPYRIGKTIPVGLTSDNAGTWEDLGSLGKVWRLTLRSEGAIAVSLYFDNFNLPAGGELYEYNASKTQVIGAFTDFNNDPSGLFATEIIEGESVTLEYYQPASVTSLPVISISNLAYIVRGVSFDMLYGKEGERGSAWCMINVNCPEGDDWQDEKRGVVRQYMILPGGYVGWCSGSLINNTAWDLAPYVFSAHHCGEGCSSSHFAQWIFYFKFESATCYGNTGPSNFTMNGCTLKAEGDRYVGSDFALYLLNQDPPDSHDPFWNGWNRTDDGSPFGVSIHHPQGDIKKISTFNTQLTSSQWNNNGVLSHWKANWAETQNGTSIVEPGSSGSPLFDSEHNIVGSLTGSPANQSCSNTLYSLYGKTYWSWDKMGSSPNQQLKHWLDPLNTGDESIAGTGGIAPIVDFEADDPTIPPGTAVDFYDLSMGNPTEWEWTFNGGEPSSSDVQNPQNIIFNNYGSYTVTLTASNPHGSDTETKNAYIKVDDPPVADFYAQDTVLAAGETTYFFDASEDDPTSWSWQFPGAVPSASTAKNPGPIYYLTPGVFLVKLTATNDFGSSTKTREGYIMVLGPPTANFTASQTQIPVGGSVDFTDMSSGDPTSWSWEFQGGTPAVSNEQHPQGIVYNEAGEFNVTLEVTGELGTDDTTMVGYIHVVAAPTPNFTCPSRYIQAGASTTFTDYSTGNPTSWYWEFEGGEPATSSQQDPGEIVYPAVGDFDVKLTVSNDFGSQSVTKPNYIHVGAAPAADFTADKTFIAAGETISFTDMTLNNPTSWNWVFEGGTPGTSTIRNPVNIAYNEVGLFDVTLTVTNTYGQDSEVKNDYVQVGYVGLDDQPLTAEHIHIYPNPTNGSLSISLNGNLEPVILLTFFNAMGERVLQISRDHGIFRQMQVSLEGNPPGLYYLHVKTENDVIVKRITLVK